MRKFPVFLAVMLSFWAKPSDALDSYRFLHVTIDTPWTIFVFLLLMVLVPFVLMAALVWRYTERKREDSVRTKDKE